MRDGRIGVDGLLEDLALQRVALSGRCPPYARALALLPSVLPGAIERALTASWGRRRFYSVYERPLLLLGALRAEARAEGPAHPLHAAFAVREPREEAVTAEALAVALDPACERLHQTLESRTVQTNETSRAVAWLWPAALAGAADGGRPLALADIGASAGLNLVGDALSAPWRFSDGAPVPVARRIHAVARLGLDANPLDASRAEDADWLRACIWPGETDREDRLEEALLAFRAARPRPDAPVLLPILAGNVPARLDLLSGTERGALVVAYQTVVRDYLSPADRTEYQVGMVEWLATHPAGHAVWVELETAPGAAAGSLPAALVAHLRAPEGGVRTLVLARCGYHPTVLEPDPRAVEEFRALSQAGASPVLAAPGV